MKEIPNTKLLVSLNHNYSESAKMEIFDLSQKTVKRIDSFDRVLGGKRKLLLEFARKTLSLVLLFLSKPFLLSLIHGIMLETGFGDVTYNSRRGLLGAISVEKETAYHLYHVGYSSQKNNYCVKLLKKSKWQPQFDAGDGG